MGIYETPYEDFGRLTYAMWRACRLVIDTGVHHMGWTRDQALAYLRERTALSEHEVTTEVDRYISWPAQALSYKLGELKILQLREEAEQALGRSEEHTSELQSLMRISYAVFCSKKKKKAKNESEHMMTDN